MASLTSNNGLRTIQYVGFDRKVKSLRLGRCEKKHAETVRSHVENILAAKQLGQTPRPETVLWLSSLGDKIYGTLERHGTVEAREVKTSHTVKGWFNIYIASRGDLSANTRRNLQQAGNAIARVTPSGQTTESFTVADANKVSRDMGNSYSVATVTTHLKKIKQVFAEAVDARLIEVNPFKDIKGGSQANAERFEYIDEATIRKVIDACPDNEWRLCFAFARFAGVRVPSELLPLRWTDINFAEGKMMIHSPKTRKHGKAKRIVPIFKSLEPYLVDSYINATDKAGAIFPAARFTNPRTQAERIIERAGLEVWGKLFQNLRSSCETDLVERFPLHVACAWIGNTSAVAAKHYLQVKQDHMKSAWKGAADSGGIQRTTEDTIMDNAINNAETQKTIPPRGVRQPADSYRVSTISKKALRKAVERQRQLLLAHAYRRVISRQGVSK